MAVTQGRRPFDFIPVMVGTGAGLGAGLLRSYGTGLPAWRMGVYEGVLIAGGVAAHFFDLNNDLAYGLQIAGAYGLAEQIAPAIKGKNAALIFSDIAEIAPSQPAAHRVSSHAGCSACAAKALRSPAAAHADIAVLVDGGGGTSGASPAAMGGRRIATNQRGETDQRRNAREEAVGVL
jgi:hypothetical protein